ncbi:MmcQ/YjbR family DNA-binding protein [Weissella hellenica]
MNKTHWLSVRLEQISENELDKLITTSFNLTR